MMMCKKEIKRDLIAGWSGKKHFHSSICSNNHTIFLLYNWNYDVCYCSINLPVFQLKALQTFMAKNLTQSVFQLCFDNTVEAPSSVDPGAVL